MQKECICYTLSEVKWEGGRLDCSFSLEKEKLRKKSEAVAKHCG